MEFAPKWDGAFLSTSGVAAVSADNRPGREGNRVLQDFWQHPCAGGHGESTSSEHTMRGFHPPLMEGAQGAVGSQDGARERPHRAPFPSFVQLMSSQQGDKWPRAHRRSQRRDSQRSLTTAPSFLAFMRTDRQPPLPHPPQPHQLSSRGAQLELQASPQMAPMWVPRPSSIKCFQEELLLGVTHTRGWEPASPCCLHSTRRMAWREYYSPQLPN